MNKLVKIIKSYSLITFILTSIFLSILATNCASTKYKLHKNNNEELKELWLKSKSVKRRTVIVNEMESRKDVDSLIFCLNYAKYFPSELHHKRGRKEKWSRFQLEDFLIIVDALGRLKDPKAIQPLTYLVLHVSNKEVKIAVLKAYQEIGNQEVIFGVTQLLRDANYDVRWKALETLAHIKDKGSAEDIFPLLFDDNPRIRWKAVHVLGEIGNPSAIDHINILLADKDRMVRESAESVLRELGAEEEKIQDWKRKANELSIEDVYLAKTTYKRAIVEKEALEAKLESEADIKKQLEDSLKKRELAMDKQEQLLDALYEKKRQLKSKLFQLEQAKKESDEYRKKLEQLRSRAQEVNRELHNAKSAKSAATAKEELGRILQQKSQVETEAKNLRIRESRLRDEISNLSDKAEETRIEAEDAKIELAATRKREMELARQVDDLKKRLDRGLAPVLVVSKPKSESRIESPTTLLHIIAVDDKGIRKIDVSLNGNTLKLDSERGITVSKISAQKFSKKLDVSRKLQLAYGENTIKIVVTDTDGMSTMETVKIVREKEQGRIWAAVIGINQYAHMRNLKYAVSDAEAFRNYLKEYIGIPDRNIFFLANRDATKERIESLLGTKIRRKASKNDTVLIFYAGHGAVEADSLDPDGDGFEKYLLPHNAKLDDLYSTAISMNEIKTIFQRIHAERLVFIADTCYSGASGGRTMLASTTRATLSEKFFERISQGRGRVIISSCSANEISKEDDLLEHGIFTYYLIRGLKGEADYDGDGLITVSELFGFLSREVPEASEQDQHPVRKGETEGALVIGYTK
jgi:HEAT repeat protein